MAYISTETVAKIRKVIKEVFPTPAYKFSIRRESGGSLRVDVLKSPYDMSELTNDYGYSSINQYHMNQYDGIIGQDATEFLRDIKEIIIKAGDWWDESDAMTDYFNTAFYYQIGLGNYEKPYEQTGV